MMDVFDQAIFTLLLIVHTFIFIFLSRKAIIKLVVCRTMIKSQQTLYPTYCAIKYYYSIILFKSQLTE